MTRAAVVGAGPAGFYASEMLMAAGVAVDLYEALPTPFGLVRAGVAPDHPKIKSVTRVYERTARRPDFRFVGGTEVGRDISCDELRDRYHAVVYAVGSPADNRLRVPGEHMPGCVAATELVAWYNGHPDGAAHEFDLSCHRAVVVGNGNVALDIARMLVLAPEELEATDAAGHALAALARSRVREVVVIGRRGPAQAAFTTPELRELGELRRAEVVVDPAELDLDPHSERWLASDGAPATARRNVELLREFAGHEAGPRTHRIVLRFLRSPARVVGDGGGRVGGLRVVRNRLQPDERGRLRAVPTGVEEGITCGLVVRAIGYRGRPLRTVPFDRRRGVIPNEAGRVLGADGTPLPGEYVVGWIKRGPSGVIGTNKKDAAETVASIIEDRDAGRLPEPSCVGEWERWIAERHPRFVPWRGWEAIDSHERAAGAPLGRPRVKVVDRRQLAAIAHAGAAVNDAVEEDAA